jgi:hypothetical protein
MDFSMSELSGAIMDPRLQCLGGSNRLPNNLSSGIGLSRLDTGCMFKRDLFQESLDRDRDRFLIFSPWHQGRRSPKYIHVRSVLRHCLESPTIARSADEPTRQQRVSSRRLGRELDRVATACFTQLRQWRRQRRRRYPQLYQLPRRHS